MKNILTIIGARPQFIKASALHRMISGEFSDRLTETILHTGQHYDIKMNQVFFDELGLPKPDVNLETGSGTPEVQIGKMVQGIGDYLRNKKFDTVVVYGDTNTTLAGALAASRNHIPVAHIEAGLRSGDKKMQEETNRILTDHLSTFLFAPTKSAINNLKKEGLHTDVSSTPSINNPLVLQSGDIMLDNLMHFKGLSPEKETFTQLKGKTYTLVTFHRSELLNDPGKTTSLLEGLLDFANTTGTTLFCPLHPATRQKLESTSDKYQKFLEHPSVLLHEPLSYLETIHVMKNAEWILTDSGGLQKEACFLEKKCLILREETEWQELLEENLIAVGGFTSSSLLNAIQNPPEPDLRKIEKIFNNEPAAKIITRTLAEHSFENHANSATFT